MFFTTQRQTNGDATTHNDHVYYNEGRETVSSVTSPPSVDEDGYLVPINQPATVSQTPTDRGKQYESLETASPQQSEPMSDNTYQTLTVDVDDYVIMK